MSPLPGAADEARARAVQDDLWAHRIYLEARKKMFASIAGVLAAIAALGLFTVYDLYSDLVDYFEEEAKARIEERINQRIDEMIGKAEPILQARLQEATNAAVTEAKAAVERKLQEATNAAVAEARTKSEALITDARQTYEAAKTSLREISGEAAAATKRLQDYAMVGKEPSSQPETSSVEPAATGCNPLALSKEQIALVAIKQRVRPADVKSSERSFHTNTFTLAAKPSEGETAAPTDEACILEAVDRVVYKLSERWFDPSEVVRIDKSDRFQFEIGVWGITPVKATVYLKGKQPALQFDGNFSTQDGRESYLAPAAG
jgi:hypothetical protein